MTDLQQLKRARGRGPFEARVKLQNDFARCPFHAHDAGGGDKTLHLNLAEDGTWLATCFSACGKTWDAIAFVQEFDKVDFAEAVRRLGGGVSTVENEQTAAKPEPEPLTAEQYAKWGREVSESDAARLAASRPHSKTPGLAALKALGCRVNGDFIAFPFFRPDGKTLYTLKKRHLDRRILPQEHSISQKGFFNLGTVHCLEDLYIIEGELDAGLLEEVGFHAVSVTTGKQKDFDAAALREISTAARIFVVGDQDETGKLCMEALFRHLPLEKTYRVIFPDGDADCKDVGELAVKYADELAGRVEQLREDSLSRCWVLENVPSIGAISDAPQKWIAERLLPEGCCTILCGKQGAQKSLLALFLAKALSAGDEEFLGRKTFLPKGGLPVLYVDRENPQSIIGERRGRLGIPEDSPMLRYWGDWCPGGETPDPEDGKLKEFAVRTKGLIIFDSLQDWYGDAKEIDNTAMVRLLGKFARLSRLCSGVLILHHDSKYGEEGYRGATAIVGVPDFSIGAAKSEDNPGVVKLREIRFRMCGSWELDFRIDFPAFGFYTLETVRDQLVSEIVIDQQEARARKADQEQADQDRVYAVIAANPKISLRAAERELGMRHQRLERLARLGGWVFSKEEGWIQNPDHHHFGRSTN